MQVRNTTTRWGAISKGLHWLVVLLVIGQFVLANLADGLPPGMAKLGMLARHKSVGLTVLALALLRLLWRISQPTPSLPPAMPVLQKRLAQGTHVLLYGLLLAMPLSGWLMSSAKNYPVSWFGLFQLPDLVAPSEGAYRGLHGAHEALAGLLVLTALLHLLGALKRHFLDRDDVLRRMLPFMRVVVPFVVLCATPVAPRPAAAAPATTAPAAALVRYIVDPARSTLEFEFRQAGGQPFPPFRGRARRLPPAPSRPAPAAWWSTSTPPRSTPPTRTATSRCAAPTCSRSSVSRRRVSRRRAGPRRRPSPPGPVHGPLRIRDRSARSRCR